MTPERYSQVKSLFQLVLEQPPPERPTFLERACGADRQLYSQVHALLQSDSTSESFLEKPAVTPISKFLADAAADLQETMPAHIGPYAVHRLLGSGGMGAVYLASRADKTFTKEVAIKVIHKGLDSDRILQRFRRERQIVASLDHPNIARLLDGGATDDGRPYIVMEYVEGMAIDLWCDQRRLNTEHRLRLFLQVCDAIHYAHQNLIIHRDIKPGNILVRPDNAVKLLDFGIAKLMDPENAAAPTEKTATSMRLMTPQYASPEQVRGEPVTTASDVYLLAIVLYELLTGHRPYQAKNDAALEAVRAFALGEPQKPSEAIFRTSETISPDGRARLTKSAAIVSAYRDGNPAALRKRLQGDLDAILLRALRRNPAERYQSTSQFAEDIRNHLSHLPISARPDNPAYRARLFLRRNMAAASIVAGAVVLLLLVTAFALSQATGARTEHLRAQARFSEARKLSHALLYDAQDSLAPLPGATPARRRMLQQALEYLGTLSNQSGDDPSLQRELAAGYLRAGHLQGGPHFPNLGDPAGAFTSYRRALSLLEPLRQRDAKTPGLSNELAEAHEALAELLLWNADSAAAVQAFRRAVELRDAANAPPESKAAAYHRLALALAVTGAHPEALAISAKAHALAQSVTGPGASRQRALSHTRLAAVRERAGDLPAAAASSRAALALYERLPNANRELSFALEDLAGIETRAGNPTAAQPLYRRALHLRRDLAASDPRSLQARRDLAYALLNQGAADDALESFRQLVLLDPANILARRDLALAWQRRGDAQLHAGNSAEALTSFRQLIETARDWLQHDAANPYANEMLALAQRKLAETEDPATAVNSARAAIRIVDSLLEKDKDNALFQRDRAQSQWVLGRVLIQSAACQAAIPELQTARRLFAAIATRNPLTGEDRDIPQAIDRQLDACRASPKF